MPIAYDRLDAERHEIRLLELQPGKPDEDITFAIRHYPLIAPVHVQKTRATQEELQKTLPAGWTAVETSQYHYRFLFGDPDEDTTWHHPDPECDPALWQPYDEMPPPGFEPGYEALSYTWGNELDSELVHVSYASRDHNAQAMRTRAMETTIRPNLASALRALHYRDKPRTLWVDAICIDQSNDDERASQVPRMAQLYTLAQRVVIWLGVDTADTGLAMKTLAHLGSQLEVSRNRTRWRSPQAVEKEVFRAATPLLYDEKTWRAIYEFLCFSWFERLWTWQEVHLANSQAVVVCGEHEMEWACLRKAIVSINSKYDLPLLELRQRLQSIELLTYEYTDASLYLLFNTSQHRFCSEPKDHVYGMLSLCPPKLAQEIIPNYDRNIGYEEVFKDVFLKYLRRVDRLDLLAACEEPSRTHHGPSWVPDYAQVRITYPLLGFALASGISRTSIRDVPSHTLQVEGVRADVVSCIRQVFPINGQAAIYALRNHCPETQDTTSYPGGGSELDALCSTLRAGYLYERWQDSTDTGLEDWKQIYLDIVTSLQTVGDLRLDHMTNNELLWCAKLVRGRAIFRTHGGYIGIGPATTQPGDTVAVLLGLKIPIILGQSRGPDSDDNVLNVRGECYVHGLEDGAALLGQLPSDWQLHFSKSSSGYAAKHSYKNVVTQEIQEDDPRLPPVPDEWERIERAREADDPAMFQWYVNKITGEEMNSDPRLTSEALKARGVQLEFFELH